MTTVFLVQHEPSPWVGIVADRIRAMGHRPVLLSAPLTAGQRLTAAKAVDDVVETADVADPEALAAKVRELASDARILTYSDNAMVATAQAAESLGVARVPASVFENIRNKFEARRIMAAAGLPNPKFALLHSADDAAAVAESVGLPAIVKPVNGVGSHLISVATTVAELAAAYERAVASLPGTMAGLYDRRIGDLDPARSLLVERRLQGLEYAVDVVVRDGVVETLGIFGKPGLDETFLEHLLVCPPFGLFAELDAVIRRVATDAVLALGLDDSVAHVELIDDAELGPTVVEVNAGRPGGALVFVIDELTTGVDPFAEAVAAALGEPPPPRTPPKVTVPIAHCIVFGTGSGRLKAIHGLDEIAETPEVLQVVPAAEPGQILSDDHEVLIVNMLLAGFLDEQELLAAHQEIQNRIRLETEPVEGNTTR
jgi:biotin carboxylase